MCFLFPLMRVLADTIGSDIKGAGRESELILVESKTFLSLTSVGSHPSPKWKNTNKTNIQTYSACA